MPAYDEILADFKSLGELDKLAVTDHRRVKLPLPFLILGPDPAPTRAMELE